MRMGNEQKRSVGSCTILAFGTIRTRPWPHGCGTRMPCWPAELHGQNPLMGCRWPISATTSWPTRMPCIQPASLPLGCFSDTTRLLEKAKLSRPGLSFYCLAPTDRPRDTADMFKPPLQVWATPPDGVNYCAGTFVKERRSTLLASATVPSACRVHDPFHHILFAGYFRGGYFGK